MSSEDSPGLLLRGLPPSNRPGQWRQAEGDSRVGGHSWADTARPEIYSFAVKGPFRLEALLQKSYVVEKTQHHLQVPEH